MTTTKVESQWLARAMAIISHVESDGCADQRAAWDDSGASKRLADARNGVDGASTPTTELADINEPQKRLAWDADIKIYDSERLASVASSSAQIRRPAIALGMLLLGLGIAWFGGWIPHPFVGAVPSSVPVDHKVASLGSDRPVTTAPPSVVDAPQQAMQGVPTDSKIDGRTADGSGSRDQTQNAVRSPSDAKIAAIPPEKSASASGSAAVHRRPKTSQMPFPETKPTTIGGWTVREVANGTVVLQGPNGVWKVARGDNVPGLGTVDSVVLWGNRWIVSTSRGLITTP